MSIPLLRDAHSSPESLCYILPVWACVLIGTLLLPGTAAAQTSNPFPLGRAGADLHGVHSGDASIGDVNGDGHLDLLLTGRDADRTPTTKLYLGNGNGTFSTAGADLEGVHQGATAIADVDGNGRSDLLIGGVDASGEQRLILYLGRDDGSFSATETDLIPVDEGDLSVGDVNGDDVPDLLVAGQAETVLYYGNGDGSFSKSGLSLPGTTEGSTVIADLVGDEHPDLFLSGSSTDGFGSTQKLYRGDGSGGFTEINPGLLTRGAPSVGDVNEDGISDFLIVGNTTELYFGASDGGFYKADVDPDLKYMVQGDGTIADVNMDGHQDLVITGRRDRSLPPTTQLYLGNGEGGFTKHSSSLTGTASGTVRSTDIGNDGDTDLLVTGTDSLSGPSARLYVNHHEQSPPNRAPRFSRGLGVNVIAPGLTLRRSVEAGDPDGDPVSMTLDQSPSSTSFTDTGSGVASLSFSPNRSQGGASVRFRLTATDDDGASTSADSRIDVSAVMATFSTLNGVSQSASALSDLDVDEHQDLVVAGQGRETTLYRGQGNGQFSEMSTTLPSVRGGSVEIADLNADDIPDVLLTGENPQHGRETLLYHGNGDGSFSPAETSLPSFEDGAASVADVNDDDRPDVLLTGSGTYGRSARLFIAKADGSFFQAQTDLSGVDNSSTAIADVNGDNNPDLLITGSKMENFDAQPSTTLYLGNGRGIFEPAGADLMGVTRGSSSIADVNADGHSDLLVTGWNGQSRTATLYLGDGTGNFTEADADLTGVRNSASAIADVNQDGHLDLLIAGEGPGSRHQTTLYLGNGDGSFSEADTGLAGVAEGSVSIGDFDGDKDPDVLLTGNNGLSRTPSAIVYENLFDAPIPVELASFEAQMSADSVALSWTTASETNNAGFQVQRKAVTASDAVKASRTTGTTGPRDASTPSSNRSGGSWTTVSFVDGAGTTSQTQHYRLTDATLPYAAHALTYRLKQIDTDGSTHYSKKITVERTVSDVQLRAPFPNPAGTQATVRYTLPDGQEASLRLYDVLGRQVRTVARSETSGRHEQQIDLDGLSSGMYFLRLSTETTIQTRRITVVQ